MKTKAVLFGIAVGDALGVPVEFNGRSLLRKNPVTDMRAYGSHLQPAGTWSDDSSLSFCLAESLCGTFDLHDIAFTCASWFYDNTWTARGQVFDIGNATRLALENIKNGVHPALAGGDTESSNGNGSLMRIAPLLFYIADKAVDQRFETTRQVSSITHRHIRSVLSCFIYMEFGRYLLQGFSLREAYNSMQHTLNEFLATQNFPAGEIALFDRILKSDISTLSSDEINSTGYVLHTLEASLWCLLTTDRFEDAVLKAVNLGDDTDTTGAVTGAWAGLHYGFDAIPSQWINALARSKDIANLAAKLSERWPVP